MSENDLAAIESNPKSTPDERKLVRECRRLRSALNDIRNMSGSPAITNTAREALGV